jgi:hypothetical protein
METFIKEKMLLDSVIQNGKPYIESRLNEGAVNSAINCELSALKKF